MRIAWFPKATDLAGNPYWPLLQQELEALGVEFESSHNSFWLSGAWLWRNRRRVQVLHFHFIQSHYAVSEERVSLRRLFKFAAYLVLARLLGYRLIWTMHDLMPTWPKEPYWIERLARYGIAWLSHDVIVHCKEAQRLLAHEFRRRHRIWVFPLPSYVEVHPNTITQSEARRWLGISPERFLIGFIGGIRPNKGLEELLIAFEHLDSSEAMLLVAGKPWPPVDYVEIITARCAEDTRIVLRAQHIPDAELQYYIQGCDMLVFPFKRVLTSSSVALAMAFGKPVIVPRLGCLPELVGTAGFIYEPDDEMGLVNALRDAIGNDNLESMGTAAAQRVNAYTWRDLAEDTLRVYGKP